MSELRQRKSEILDRIRACAIKGENVPNHPASFGPEGEAYNEGVFAAFLAVQDMGGGPASVEPRSDGVLPLDDPARNWFAEYQEQMKRATRAEHEVERLREMYRDAETRVGLANRKRRTCTFCGRRAPELPDLSYHGKDE